MLTNLITTHVIFKVVTITVYSIGVASLMARQLADKNPATSFITGYFPMLNTFQVCEWKCVILLTHSNLTALRCLKYFLYLSWLRFGAMASNPFGEDDDDIDITKLLQSHIEVCGICKLSGLWKDKEFFVLQLQDAQRLQALYVTGPADELVTTSIETPSKKWPVHLHDI